MDSPYTWTCPGCGTVVALPAYCRPNGGPPDSGRLDRVARCLCGCWVKDLPEEVVARLLEAVTNDAETGSFRVPGHPGTAG